MLGKRLKIYVAAAGAVLFALSACAPTAPTTNDPKVLEARRLDSQGQTDAALAALDQAVRDRPDDTVAWAFRGALHLKKQRYPQAVSDFSRAIALNETDIGYSMRGKARVRMGLYDDAIADFNKAEAMGHRELSTTIYRGQAYFEKGQHQQALEYFTAAIATDPNHFAAYGWRGSTLTRLGRYPEALSDFERYLPIIPHDVPALWDQGQAFLKTGQTERARENVRKLIELDPRLAVNFSGERALDLYDLDKRRTVVKQALGDAKEAEAGGQWQKAFEHFEWARSYVTGRRAEDREDQKTILEGVRRSYAMLSVKPELPEAARRFVVQAVSMAEQKDYERAVQLYGKGLGVAYWWPEAHFNSALLLADQTRFVEAIAEMKAFLDLAPASADARAAQDKIYEWELKAK